MDECLNKMNCVDAITKWMNVATNANECNNVQRQQEEDVVGCQENEGCPSQSDDHWSS